MDNTVLYLTSPMPPSWNHYLGWKAIKKGGKWIATSYLTKEAKKYKESFKKYIKEQVKAQGFNIEVNKTQHFYVDAVFYFDRIDKDSSNYDKCLLDAITDTQLVWVDDNVALFRAQRVYYDSESPRIELTIYPVDYIGIFDNVENMNTFISKCKNCNRYNRNCSILASAIKGKVQPEINNLDCTEYKEKKRSK